MTAPAEPSQSVLRAYGKGLSMVRIYEEPFPKVLMTVPNGYWLRSREWDKNFRRVELNTGKEGYVQKDQLFEDKNYPGKDSYPAGSQCLRASETTTRPIYVVEPTFKEGIIVHEEPGEQSRELFVLAPLEAVFIVETLPWYYKVSLPGPTEGFVLRNQGARRDWAPELTTHFGFYGIRKSQASVVLVRYAPNVYAEAMAELDAHSRLPVIEEWDGWFKVQLDDGCQGFVPEAFGNRTIYAGTFVDKPKEGSGLARAGLVALGVLTAATVGAALHEDA